MTEKDAGSHVCLEKAVAQELPGCVPALLRPALHHGRARAACQHVLLQRQISNVQGRERDPPPRPPERGEDGDGRPPQQGLPSGGVSGERHGRI